MGYFSKFISITKQSTIRNQFFSTNNQQLNIRFTSINFNCDCDYLSTTTTTTATTTVAPTLNKGVELKYIPKHAADRKGVVGGGCVINNKLTANYAISVKLWSNNQFDYQHTKTSRLFSTFNQNQFRFVNQFNRQIHTTTLAKMSDEQAKAQTAKDDGQETIFGKMLSGKIPAKFIFEDDLCVAFDDINPVAPVHFLVIPRQSISSLSKTTDDDEKILGHMMCVARKVAEQKGLATNGYRLVMNNGPHGCQSVYHIHLHVIGGRQLGWPPC